MFALYPYSYSNLLSTHQEKAKIKVISLNINVKIVIIKKCFRKKIKILYSC